VISDGQPLVDHSGNEDLGSADEDDYELEEQEFIRRTYSVRNEATLPLSEQALIEVSEFSQSLHQFP
jgi:hypothetical protein